MFYFHFYCHFQGISTDDKQECTVEMNNLHNRLTSDLGKKNEIFYYS